MKRKIGILLSLVLILICAFALADVPIDEEHFPGFFFRSYISDNFDVNRDDILSDEEIALAEEMEGHDLYDLDTFKGIEYFTALKRFDLCGHNVTEIDFSQNKKLSYIDLWGNEQLEKVTLTGLSELTHIFSSGCSKLNEIDLSTCSAMLQAFADGHMYPYYDFSERRVKIRGPESGDCMSFELGTHINLGGIYPELALNAANFPDAVLRQYLLDCRDFDQDGMLDEFETASIYDFDFPEFENYPGIQSFEGIQNLRNIRVIFCNNDKLSTLNLTNKPKLFRLEVMDTNLKEIDISECPILIELVTTTEPFLYSDTAIAFGPESYLEYDPTDPYLCCNRDVVIRCGDQILYEGNVKISKITLNKTKATLTRTLKKTKPTLQLKATVKPANATNPSVEWSSSNPKVAKVDQNGKVTALKNGKAIITCKAKDGGRVSATCSITVKSKLVTKIVLNKKKATVKKGKTLELKVKTIKPTDALNQKVKWTSSNKKIATVDKNGKVKALKKGTCIITCSATDGSGRKVICKITVK